jgi:ABC-type amino acid transport substrate-binding protein
MNRFFFIAVFIISLLAPTALIFAGNNVIIMGYKDEPNLPNIGAPGDDKGIYLDLYGKAAKMIGCKLQIVRQPKVRIYNQLKDGTVDFYPSSSFDKERTDYIYWLNNGLTKKSICLTRSDVPEITDLSKAGPLKFLVELGNSKDDFNKTYPNLKIEILPKLSMDIAVKALKEKRGDIYLFDEDIINYYKTVVGIKNYSEIGLKTHTRVFPAETLFLGFSQKSQNFSGTKNPNYNASKAISIENFPVTINNNSNAAKFANALLQMKKNGDVTKILNKYYK